MAHSRWQIVLFLLLSVWIALSSSKEAVDPRSDFTKDLLGSGDVAIGQQIKEWVAAFTAFNLDLASGFTYYHSIFGFDSDLTFLNNRSSDFVAVDIPMDKKLRKAFPDLVQLPISVQPILFHYFVPGLPVYTTTTGVNETLIMDMELLADIYLGIVRFWNDSRIARLNPHFPGLPDIPIVPIAFADDTDHTTQQLTQAFAYHSKRFRRRFPESPFNVWPRDERTSHLIFVPGGYGTYAGVDYTSGSIGYMTLPIYLFASSGTTPYVKIQYQGEVYSATQEHLYMYIKDAKYDERTGEVVNLRPKNSSRGWPIPSFSYLAVQEKTYVTEPLCEQDRKMLMFFRWILIDSTAEDQGRFNGFFRLPRHITEPVVKKILGLKCGEDRDVPPLLVIEVVNDHNEAYFEALLAVSMVIAGIFIIPGIYFFTLATDAQGNRSSLVAMVYGVLLVLGAFLAYLSIVFFYLVPDATWVCQLRQWLLGVGFSILLGAMFTRTLQIHRIFRISKKRSISNHTQSKMKRRALRDFLVGIGAALFLQVMLLAIWTGADPLEARLSTISDIQRTASWVCKSDKMWLWLGLEIAFFVCLLIYGVFIVYRTWDIKSKFVEARWLLMSIYNLLLTLAALIPIFVTIKIKDDTLFIMTVAGVVFVVSSTLFAVYIPKLGQQIEKFIFYWRSSSSETSGSNASASTRKSTRTGGGSSMASAGLDSSM